VVAEIGRLKDQPGADIVQYGFGRLSYTLMEHGLLDELRLWVQPFFVGRGGPADLLFRTGPPASFDLAGSTALKSGIVLLSYRYRRSGRRGCVLNARRDGHPRGWPSRTRDPYGRCQSTSTAACANWAV
jgi:hypothetical protein